MSSNIDFVNELNQSESAEGRSTGLAVGVNESSSHRSTWRNLNATRVIATTVGVLFGISGMNHGFFEFLQGNIPTPGLLVHAIGEAHKYWELGTEDAFTVIPNFMITGILAMVVGLAIVIWSLWFIQTRHGPTVFIGLFILLFLVGGGVGQLVFFIPAWAFATQMDKPLTGWRKVLPRRTWPFLSKLWIVTLVAASIFVLIGLEMAIFGYFPGMTDPQTIQDTCMSFVGASAVLFVISFIAGFGHELLRMDSPAEMVS